MFFMRGRRIDCAAWGMAAYVGGGSLVVLEAFMFAEPCTRSSANVADLDLQVWFMVFVFLLGVKHPMMLFEPVAPNFFENTE